jgi:hypothetical protein
MVKIANIKLINPIISEIVRVSEFKKNNEIFIPDPNIAPDINT